MNFNHRAEKMYPIRNASEIIFVLLLLEYSSYGDNPKFRSKTGCCICWTKSQTGKPVLKSKFYKERFPEVFGVEAQDGDIYSACIGGIRSWKSGDPQKREVSFVICKEIMKMCTSDYLDRVRTRDLRGEMATIIPLSHPPTHKTV